MIIIIIHILSNINIMFVYQSIINRRTCSHFLSVVSGPTGDSGFNQIFWTRVSTGSYQTLRVDAQGLQLILIV